jgi:hypothetical protein
MSLHDDLLEQALLLARLDPRRPKQVNLRRAVSSAYYALFHLLTAEASAMYAADAGLQALIARTYNHGDMKRISTFFANDRRPRALQPVSGVYATPPELKNVAQTFLDLQEARHEADYNLAHQLTRRRALALAQQVQQAFADWNQVKRTDDARVYLACLLLWKRWDEEPR